MPAAALRQCTTARQHTTVSQWSTQLSNLATNFAQHSAGPQPRHPCSRRQSNQYNPSIQPAVRLLSVRTHSSPGQQRAYNSRHGRSMQSRYGGWCSGGGTKSQRACTRGMAEACTRGKVGGWCSGERACPVAATSALGMRASAPCGRTHIHSNLGQLFFPRP